MTVDGVSCAPTLKKVDVGIVVADATDATHSASDVVSAAITNHAVF